MSTWLVETRRTTSELPEIDADGATVALVHYACGSPPWVKLGTVQAYTHGGAITKAVEQFPGLRADNIRLTLQP